jgi:integrase
MIGLPPRIAFSEPLTLPVRVIKVDGLPKIIAGGVPVTPINVVLARRQRYKGASPDGLDPYTRASRLYSEFCAHLGRCVTDISDEDFLIFKDALLGLPFNNSEGLQVCMIGTRQRGERTADLMLSLIYSVAGDVEELYKVRFEWRRYGRVPIEFIDMMRLLGGRRRVISFPRAHRIKWTPRKVVGLPDEQFVKLIEGARRRWFDSVPDGDTAYADLPDSQRGALFYRNVAILFILRYAGSRRGEVVFIRPDDIDRETLTLRLVTKGHGGEYGERLPVILFPFVDELVWRYVTKFRPDPKNLTGGEGDEVFLSHSVRNYGQPITAQTVRKIIETLREDLDTPWNTCLTPHMLRHSFGYHVQRLGGSAAVMASMRHASSASGEPYSSGIENFVEELLEPFNDDIEDIAAQAGLLGYL